MKKFSRFNRQKEDYNVFCFDIWKFIIAFNKRTNSMTMYASIRWIWWKDITNKRSHWLMIHKMCCFAFHTNDLHLHSNDTHFPKKKMKIKNGSRIWTLSSPTPSTNVDAVGKSTASINFKLSILNGEKRRGSTLSTSNDDKWFIRLFLRYFGIQTVGKLLKRRERKRYENEQVERLENEQSLNVDKKDSNQN